jgi:hypothetical protein
MNLKKRTWRRLVITGLLGLSLAALSVAPAVVEASPLDWWRNRHACRTPSCDFGEEPPSLEVGGTWYWLRSPEQEKRFVTSVFNHYCIRCHGIDGRGVWDIPDVPNFTNARWQASRTDGQLARAILEGRGSVMPPWRGTLSLEEAWAMARYVRTLGAATELSRPDLTTPEKPATTTPATTPKPTPEQ